MGPACTGNKVTHFVSYTAAGGGGAHRDYILPSEQVLMGRPCHS